MNDPISILARARDTLDDLDLNVVPVVVHRAHARAALDSIIEYLTRRAAEGKPLWRDRG